LGQPRRTSENSSSRDVWKIETVWKIAWRVLNRQYLVTLEGESEHSRPVFATRYTPDRGLFGFSRQFLERLSGKSLAVCLAGLLGRRNGPLRPTFVAAKRTSDAPEHRPGDFSRQSLEKLSDKSLEGSRASVLVALKAAKWRFWVRFDHSWESGVGLFRNYQTVSRDCLETRLERRQRG
jgi:hypothetical protein